MHAVVGDRIAPAEPSDFAARFDEHIAGILRTMAAPYINTLAAVAISPAGASPEKSTYVAQAVDVIRQSGLPSETNAMFTNIEGDIDDVLKVIRDATMKLAGQGYRTDVVIRLDIRPGFEGQIHAKQALVDEILSE